MAVLTRATPGPATPSRRLRSRLAATSTMPATTASALRALSVACLIGTNSVFCQSSETTAISASSAEPSISDVSISPTALSPGDAFTATWIYSTGESAEPATTGDLTTFDIDLDLCVDGAGNCKCDGNSLIPLCPDATDGCVDRDGSYDLALPDADGSITVVVGLVYQVRVSLASDPTVFACGWGFVVQESDGVSLEVTSAADDAEANSEQHAAQLTVIAPTETLVPGAAFTAQWVYDDGLGGDDEDFDGVGGSGDFAIDLHTCADGACSDGSCGTFLAALCDDDGCHDPGTGDYDVVIPEDVVPGVFTLHVEELSENGPSDCSAFNVSRNTSETTPNPSSAPHAAPTLQPVRTTLEPSSAPVSPAPTTSAPTTAAPTALPPVGAPGSPGVPPIPVPAKPVCDKTAAVSFSYADDDVTVTVEHLSGNRSDAGCVSMTKLWEWLQTEPVDVPVDLVYPVNPVTGEDITDATTSAELTGVWHLRTTLKVTNGVILEIKGTAASGDCDELKIRSTDSQIHAVTGHGGSIDIYKTKIQSWDASLGEPHVLPVDSSGSEPRSYISCVSEVVNESDTCGTGAAQKDMGECRMDMEDSELGYLGYYDTEAYGITWKVRGFCKDLSNLEVFDNVDVWGDIKNCDIHHMWYGMYSYGHYGGVWINNLMHDNHVYGFDPHDDSDYLTIHNNTVYNNGKHGIIASKRCNNLSVKYNKVDTSGGSGIMLHRSCDDSVVSDNVVHGSSDAGMALVETNRATVRDNVFADGKWGARLTVGSTDNQIFNNLFQNNYKREFYLYDGADDPWVATSVNVNNTFDSNVINYNANAPINMEYAEGTIITNNVFNGTGGYFEFDEAFNTRIVDNSGEIIESEEHRVLGGSCFTEDTPLDPTCS